MEEPFKLKCYTWKELGLLYSPGLTPESAAKRLKRWVHTHTLLKDGLLKKGWEPSVRILPPHLVKVITDYLGEP